VSTLKTLTSRQLIMFFLFFLLINKPVLPWSVDNHRQITKCAISKLLSGGYRDEARFYTKYSAWLIQGTWDADLKPKSFEPMSDSTHHGHDPWYHLGFPPSTKPAGKYAQIYSDKALQLLKNNPKEAFRYLGAALHLLEDNCITVHSNPLKPDNLKYHGALEKYIKEQTKGKTATQLEREGWIDSYDKIYDFVPFEKNGIVHCDAETTFGWVDKAAHESYDYYNDIKGLIISGTIINPSDHYLHTCKEMHKLAVKMAAGFLRNFHDFVPLELRKDEDFTVWDFKEGFDETEWLMSKNFEAKKGANGLIISGGCEYNGPMGWGDYGSFMINRGTLGWRNYELNVSGRILSDIKGFGAWGPVFRARGSNQYRVQYDPGAYPNPGIQLATLAWGDHHEFTHYSLDRKAHNLRVVVFGKVARCFIDDHLIFTHRSVQIESGAVGVFINRFKKAQIYSIWLRPLP